MRRLRTIIVAAMLCGALAACEGEVEGADGNGGESARGGDGDGAVDESGGGSGGNSGAGSGGASGAGVGGAGASGAGAGGAGVGGGSGGQSGGAGAIGADASDVDSRVDEEGAEVPEGWASLEARCGTTDLAYPSGTRIFVGGGGEQGRTAVTTDGVTWQDRTTVTRGPMSVGHTRNLIRAGAYGHGVFVFVGAYDNAYITASCDGVTWRDDLFGTNVDGDAQNFPEDFHRQYMAGVAYGQGAFVAGGANGTIVRSTDGGVTWASVRSGLNGAFRGLAYGAGRFVAVGRYDNGDGFSAASTDGGASWSAIMPVEGGTPERGIAYGNDVFVAVSETRCIVTTDGLEWEDCGHGQGAVQHFSAFFADGRFYVGLQTGYVHSADGANWEYVSGGPGLPQSMAYADGRYVGTRHSTRGFSLDLQSWTETEFGADVAGLRQITTGLVP